MSLYTAVTAGPFDRSLLKIWKGLSLDCRFATLALFLAIASTFAIGGWVSRSIENRILSRSSGVASVYISDLVSPLVQELASSDRISAESRDQLDALLVSGALRLHVVAIKVWNSSGTIVYSSSRDLVGKRFAPSQSLLNAFAGAITSEVNEPSAESAPEFSAHDAIFEVYAPVYDQNTGKVIAVAEFYEDAAELVDVVATAKLHSWMFTFFILSCNVLGFLAVVHGASRIIDQQRDQLSQQINQLSRAVARETALRTQIERGAQNVFDENERFLRALGADLHDGPAQLIGLALLRLDDGAGGVNRTSLEQARTAIAEAMRDVRAIAAGLLLPDISGRTLEDCLAATVRNHEARTGTSVTLVCENLTTECSDQVRICVCRFIQEGLANSFRHAQGIGQRVTVVGETDFIRVTVSDSGPGMPKGRVADGSPHLGLISLKNRLESLNGTMTVSSWPRRGTQLVARLPLKMEKPDAV